MNLSLSVIKKRKVERVLARVVALSILLNLFIMTNNKVYAADSSLDSVDVICDTPVNFVPLLSSCGRFLGPGLDRGYAACVHEEYLMTTKKSDEFDALLKRKNLACNIVAQLRTARLNGRDPFEFASDRLNTAFKGMVYGDLSSYIANKNPASLGSAIDRVWVVERTLKDIHSGAFDALNTAMRDFQPSPLLNTYQKPMPISLGAVGVRTSGNWAVFREQTSAQREQRLQALQAQADAVRVAAQQRAAVAAQQQAAAAQAEAEAREARREQFRAAREAADDEFDEMMRSSLRSSSPTRIPQFRPSYATPAPVSSPYTRPAPTNTAPAAVNSRDPRGNCVSTTSRTCGAP